MVPILADLSPQAYTLLVVAFVQSCSDLNSDLEGAESLHLSPWAKVKVFLCTPLKRSSFFTQNVFITIYLIIY